jgi:hypothetical protein
MTAENPPIAAHAGTRMRIARYDWIVGWWALSRLLAIVPAVVAQETGWPRAVAEGGPLAVLGAWDGRWYGALAVHGYLAVPDQRSDTAFFPLYPLAMRALHGLGLSTEAGGLLISNLLLLAGLVALYELVLEWVDEATARRAVVFAALFPLSFVFSMAYPESLVLAATALAGVLAYRGRWLGCAVAVACATLARPEGIFVIIPVAAIALARRERDGRALAAVAAGPAALLALVVYEWDVVGDAFAFSHAQDEWGRRTSIDGIGRAFEGLADRASLGGAWVYRDLAFCMVYLVCLGLALRARVPASWVVAGVLIVLLPLWSGSFISDARFGLIALPVYVGLAYVARRRPVDVALRVVSAVLLAIGSATVLLHWP